MNQTSRIKADITFDRPGKHEGCLRVPFSSNRSAYGWISIPFIVINNGTGPKGLLTAGVHGDEWEGQIAMTKIAQLLQPEEVIGRLIILPGLNSPAVRASTRLSPIDGQNLNRAFPGDPDGSTTMMIAHFIETCMFPMVDFAVDLHSGGSSLLHLPCVLMRNSADADRRQKMRDAIAAFGAPLALVKSGQPGEEGLLDRGMAGAAERAGKILISSELGGGGTVSKFGVELAEAGTLRLLSHFGVLGRSLTPELTGSGCRNLEVRPDDFLYASVEGIFEPAVSLGDQVVKGQIAGWVYSSNNPMKTPSVQTFTAGGLVVCQRSFGRTEVGDCLFHTASDCEQS